jgi:ABC-type Co2+ transport system permease subunit
MVVVTLALLFPIHVLFSGHQVNRMAQLPIVLLTAIAGGFSVYIALFFDAIFSRNAFSTRLAVEHCAMGLLAALCAWMLYNFGPLRLAAKHTSSTVEWDGPNAARP